MRIIEITDENKTWAILKDFDFDKTIESFNLIIKAWPILLNTRAPSLIEYHKRNILSFLDQINLELEELRNFPDQTDPDILKIQETLMGIKNTLIELLD